MRNTHIILTLGRSGSNTLVDMLNQNPAILNFGEVLGDWTQIRQLQQRLRLYRDNDRAYLTALLQDKRVLWAANTFRNATKLAKGKPGECKRLARVESVGFKEFSLNLTRRDLQDFPTDLTDLKVIGLSRRNVIERMISNEFLVATGIVLSRGDDAAPQRQLYLDPADVIAKLDVIEQENHDLEKMLTTLPEHRVFRLDYDALYSQPDKIAETMEKLHGFLGVRHHAPQIRMKKIGRKHPLASLTNGPEIAETLAGTRFQKWLEPQTP